MSAGVLAMTPERWRRVKAVFVAAIEVDPARRAPLVAELCGGDGALRSEVLSLIAAHESATDGGIGLPAPAAPRPEPTFAGNARFTIEDRLGAGGFGVVFRALDRDSGRPVALKVLRQSDGAGLIRFKREFRALADLAHDNLARLHELFVEGQGQGQGDAARCFFTMELVQGRPLVEALRGAAGGQERVARAFRALADGVTALHREGLLHRDLKPSNVLLSDEGRVVILDFGLATMVRALDAAAPAAAAGATAVHATDARGPICGTPAYMAPEQFLGDGVSAASDWYGVGTMLFEALSGQLPFSGDVLALMEAKAAAAPALPAAVLAAFPLLAPLAVRLLAPDPAQRPDGAAITRALDQAAGQSVAASPAARAAPRALFVGRESQLQALRAAWARARAGALSVVCVRGSSGMGKTALVRRFLGELDGALVLSGRCHEREALAFKALDGVVDGLGQFVKTLPRAELEALAPAALDDLGRLFPVLRLTVAMDAPAASSRDDGTRRPDGMAASADSVEQRRRAFDGLRALLGALARRQPCAVFIDDLQWGDDDSAALLRHLLRAPDAPPLLLIAACRGDEGAAPAFAALLEALRASGPVDELPLGVLTAGETRALASRLLGGDSAAVDAVVAEAAGVPFFVDTLVERLHDAEAGGARGAAGAPAPAAAGGHELRLQTVLKARVDDLPAGARRLLEVVALAGKPLRRGVARQAADIDRADDGGDERVLRARHLLRLGTDGASLETYHDRIRDTVTHALPPAIVPGLHARIVAALFAAGSADPEDLAHHLSGAGESAAAAGHAAEAARRRARALAFDRAAALFQMAIDLKGATDPDDAEIAALTAEMADALAAAGRGEKAGEAYLAAAAISPARPRARELRFHGALQFLRAGQIDRGRALMAAALRTLGWRVSRTTLGALLSVIVRRLQLALRGLRFPAAPPSGPRPAASLLRVDGAWMLASSAMMVDTVRATYYQTFNLLFALQEGEPMRLARALGLEAIHASVPGARSPKRADRIVALLRQVAAGARDPMIDGLAPLAEGVVCSNRAQWRRARGHYLKAMAALAAQGGGVSFELATTRSFLLGALVSLGEFREFSERFPAFLDDARTRGDLYAEAVLVLSSGAYIVPLMDDRVADADQQTDAALGRLPARGFQMVKAWGLFAKVDIALYAGDAEKAWRLECESWPRLSRSVLLFVQIARVYLRHQRGRAALALALQRPAGAARDRLARVAAGQVRALEGERVPWADGLAAALRAGIALCDGDRAGAAELLLAASQRLDGADMAMHTTVCRLARGTLVGGADGDSARDDAVAWMRAQRVVRPECVARTVFPGVVV